MDSVEHWMQYEGDGEFEGIEIWACSQCGRKLVRNSKTGQSRIVEEGNIDIVHRLGPKVIKTNVILPGDLDDPYLQPFKTWLGTEYGGSLLY